MTEFNGEHDEMRERLARIEAHQTHVVKQLDRMVTLLDTLARVEEHVAEHNRTLGRMFTRLEAAELELETWRSARKVFLWLSGIAATAIVAIVAMFEKS